MALQATVLSLCEAECELWGSNWLMHEKEKRISSICVKIFLNRTFATYPSEQPNAHYLYCCLVSPAWLWNPVDCSPLGPSVCGILPSKNTAVTCPFRLQGIFLTQGWNSHCLQVGWFFTAEPTRRPELTIYQTQNHWVTFRGLFLFTLWYFLNHVPCVDKISLKKSPLIMNTKAPFLLSSMDSYMLRLK